MKDMNELGFEKSYSIPFVSRNLAVNVSEFVCMVDEKFLTSAPSEFLNSFLNLPVTVPSPGVMWSSSTLPDSICEIISDVVIPLVASGDTLLYMMTEGTLMRQNTIASAAILSFLSP